MSISDRQFNELSREIFDRITKELVLPSSSIIDAINEALPKGSELDAPTLVQHFVPEVKRDATKLTITREQELQIRGLGTFDVDIDTHKKLCQKLYQVAQAETALINGFVNDAIELIECEGTFASGVYPAEIAAKFTSEILGAGGKGKEHLNDFVAKAHAIVSETLIRRLNLHEAPESKHLRNAQKQRYTRIQEVNQALKEESTPSSSLKAELIDNLTEKGLSETAACQVVAAKSLDDVAHSLSSDQLPIFNNITKENPVLQYQIEKAYILAKSERKYLTELIEEHQINQPHIAHFAFSANRNAPPAMASGEQNSEAYQRLLSDYQELGVCDGEHSARETIKTLSDNALRALQESLGNNASRA